MACMIGIKTYLYVQNFRKKFKKIFKLTNTIIKELIPELIKIIEKKKKK